MAALNKHGKEIYRLEKEHQDNTKYLYAVFENGDMLRKIYYSSHVGTWKIYKRKVPKEKLEELKTLFIRSGYKLLPPKKG